MLFFSYQKNQSFSFAKIQLLLHSSQLCGPQNCELSTFFCYSMYYTYIFFIKNDIEKKHISTCFSKRINENCDIWFTLKTTSKNHLPKSILEHHL